MDLDPAEVAGFLPFEGRYERRRRRWHDGPLGSREAFGRVPEREVVLNIAWGDSDVGAFVRAAGVAAPFRHTSDGDPVGPPGAQRRGNGRPDRR